MRVSRFPGLGVGVLHDVGQLGGREVDEQRQGLGLVRHASDGQERLFQVHAGNFEFDRPVPGVEEGLQDAVGVGWSWIRSRWISGLTSAGSPRRNGPFRTSRRKRIRLAPAD